MPLIKGKQPKKEPRSDDATSKIASIIESFRGEQGEEGKPGKDGVSANPQDVAKVLERNSTFVARIKGQDGVDGKDGVDGLDGYTPIKGVDYFDGLDGMDGKDGKDGVDGKDGSPDTPEQILKKIKGRMNVDDIKGLEDALSRRIPVDMIGAPRIPVYSNGVLQPSPLGSLNITGGTLTANPGTQDYTISVTGGGHTIQDEGVSLPQRTNLNFIGGNIIATDNAGTNSTDITVTGAGGSGDVVGPASSTADAVALYNGTTGKLIKNSTLIYTGDILSGLDGVDFDGVSSPTYAQGKLVYDTDNESLTFFNNNSNVALQVGQEEWIRVTNNTGSTIANGAAVYLNGASGGMPTIALAQANAAATTIGAGLTTQSIANGAIGYVTCIGIVRGLDTSLFTAGQTVYISSTVAGGLTATAPTAPNYRYRVGIVGVSSATVGTIHVTPSTASLGNGTANQIFGINAAGTAQEVKTVQGTASQVTITHTANTITASLPATINVNTSGSAATLTTPRTIGIATGDVTSAGSTFNGSANNTNAYTLATVNANVGSFGSSTAIPNFTVNAKGLITAAGTNAVIAPAGTLTGTTLAANVVSSSLTSVGTISTGVWQGTAVDAQYGGTGQVAYNVGDLLYASTNTALSRLADIATGNALISGGVGVAPSWGKIGLTTHVSGTLAIGNGGTGKTSATTGYVLFGAYDQDSNLFWDNTNKRLGVGTSSPLTKFTVNLSNNDYVNTGGANSHLTMTNPDATGQNVVSSVINGNVVAKWRTDYVGNISWVAGPTGSHDFYTGGDFGVGTSKMTIGNGGNVIIPATLGVSTYASIGTTRVAASPSSTSDVGVFNIVTTTTPQLQFGGYSGAPFAMWMQTKQTTNGGATFPIAINPLGGNVGIGLSAPTAKLHLPAGTATASTAPLKFTAGTVLTSPEAGVMEFTNSETGLTFTAVGTRRQVVLDTSTQTLTNKRVTPRAGTTTSNATPTFSTDSFDYYELTAQSVNITSFTTGITGTPTKGQQLWISVTATGAVTVTWGTLWESSAVITLPAGFTTTRTDMKFIWNDVTSKWRIVGLA